MSDNSTTTFAKFIRDHKIQIPLIQRDYVQGRAIDDKSIEKRYEFVTKLMEALLPDNKPCTLDFVYGARENYGYTNSLTSDTPFLPLDGQQRLTTLFLLHWLLLQKERKLGNLGTTDNGENTEALQLYASRINLLKGFSYKTRISSDRFCEKLIDTSFEPIDIVSQINQKYWYDNDMKSDPTIQAMMQMLELMENMLDNSYQDYIEVMCENLYEKDCITFEILDMDKYNLTDGLYVKMNARGKELTPFENWKADFIGLLSDNIDDKERFTEGIEHDWNDVFWGDAYKDYLKIKSQNDSMGIQTSYPRIDELFMNYFSNMSRLLYFIKHPDYDATSYKSGLWTTTIDIFSGHENRQIFFNMLDALSRINKNNVLEDFFDNIFYTSSSSPWEEKTSKVKIFGDNTTNLFATICRADALRSHILLFAILKYCVKYSIYDVNDNLRNYVRICRNYLDEHFVFDRNSVTVIPQIRANDMKRYDEVFESLLNNEDPFISLRDIKDNSSEYLLTEAKKERYYSSTEILPLIRKIEDMSYTLGNISAFENTLDRCLQEPSICQKVWEGILDFRNASQLEKVEIFISFGYRGVEVKNCAYGKTVFVGGEFNKTQRWSVHFRKRGENALRECMNRYIAEYLNVGNLHDIISSITNISSPSTAIEYMLKYPNILASMTFWNKETQYAPFYFAMKNPWKDLDMITIHSFSKNPLNNAYQTCPMCNAVVRILPKYSKYVAKGRMGCVGQNANKNGIVINDNGNWKRNIFALYFGSMEWFITQESFDIISDQLKQHFSPHDNIFVLEYKENDLIQAAFNIMNLIINEFEDRQLL